MNIYDLVKSIKEINECDNSEFSIEKYIDLTRNVIKLYDDNSFNSKLDNMDVLYDYLICFFHKYAGCLYQENVLAKIDSNSTRSFFNSSNFEITYSRNLQEIFKHPAFYHAFTVFHENRHAVQASMYKKDSRNILNIDPLAIVMLKENILASCTDLYERNDRINHSLFVLENDANLVTLGYLDRFLKAYFLDNYDNYYKEISKRVGNGEKNYGKVLLNPKEIVKHNFLVNDKDTLPVFYEASRVLRKNVSKELVEKYPLLKFICTPDGRMKTYQEVINDGFKLIEKVENIDISVLDAFSGTNGYQGKVKRLARHHIEFIYLVIINSDPILYMEDAVCNKRFSELNEILTNCPKLVDLYFDELQDILCRYLSYKNYHLIRKEFSNDLFNRLSSKLDVLYKKIIIKLVYKHTGIEISKYANNSMNIKEKRFLEEERYANLQLIDSFIRQGEIKPKRGAEYKRIINELFDEYVNEAKFAEASFIGNDDEDISFANIIADRIYSGVGKEYEVNDEV